MAYLVWAPAGFRFGQLSHLGSVCHDLTAYDYGLPFTTVVFQRIVMPWPGMNSLGLDLAYPDSQLHIPLYGKSACASMWCSLCISPTFMAPTLCLLHPRSSPPL